MLKLFRSSNSKKNPPLTYREVKRKTRTAPKWVENSLDFNKIKEKCLRDKILFEDLEFPAEDKSVGLPELAGKIEWKRPGEICKTPHFTVDGFSRFDIMQGDLGDCWLLASISSLSSLPHLLQHVVPLDQSFAHEYAGVFHFRFWHYGRWIEVVIDDRLPTCDGKLIFLHSTQNNEFWSALLEKAYAKLNGSYEALDLGDPCESMEDFTGGLAESYDLNESVPDNLYEILRKAYDKNGLMACSINGVEGEDGVKTSSGLVLGHAYSITRVHEVTLNNGKQECLLRIRNPFGNELEWNEKWGDKSSEWNLVSEDEKTQMGYSGDSKDGEFWMTYSDWLNHFDHVEICHMSNSLKMWDTTNLFEGEWKGDSAGGCSNYADTFHLNPQFSINIEKPAEDLRSVVIIALMQKNRMEGMEMGPLGMEIFNITKYKDLTVPLEKRFFDKHKAIATYKELENTREISLRVVLDPGTYVIVPYRYRPGEEGKFIIRIMKDLNADNLNAGEKFQRVAGIVTRILRSFRKKR